ncbi:YdeI/OmpD-associated family protein [Romboutsia ilealis]|uniref:YdeI/OmpD-associated family protein n=1 Tax=Romboutsia ilealis TaxID=1115758 RepID=UPI00272CEBA5|nr:YdeI/OmpD-associated family protein [Romboutsia ilealis]
MTYKFEVIIQQVENKDATFIEIPFDVEKEFGAKMVKVKAKFDNIDYRGSIVRMGMPCFIIGLTKEIRKKIGKGIGDTVSVEIEKDEEERIVEIPIEFKSMLNGNNNAKDFFNSLSYSQKKKYITWITSAKKEETKIKRMNEALLKLEGKVKL